VEKKNLYLIGGGIALAGVAYALRKPPVEEEISADITGITII